jgi:uncharacterized protein YprB with RNaseH-like and TPR domain
VGSALASALRSHAAADPGGAPQARSPRAIPGAPFETPHGVVQLVDASLAPDHRHGEAPLARALEVRAEVVAQLALDPALAEVDFRRALFFDTETTGLAGGTGTVPFLIGLAFFEGARLRVQQLFLPELGREAPMLRFLAERVAEASCLVSYNGKAFDWPLLRTRFVMNRVPAPAGKPHLDLLHCARRAFKGRLGSLRLVTMERELLGMTRVGDIDGAAIPGVYWSWSRYGGHPELERVIAHNGHDLVALAALLGELERRYAALGAEDDPRDHLAFARIAARAGDAERARRFASAAAEGGSPSCAIDARLLVARLARRAGDAWAEERALHAALEGAAPDARPLVRLALAKLYEHRLRRPSEALAHAALAGAAESPEAHARRLARLGRRIARAARSRPALEAACSGMVNGSASTLCSAAPGAGDLLTSPAEGPAVAPTNVGEWE